MSLSFKEVAEIIKIIDASECEELSLELEGIRLSVRRASTSGTTTARQEELPRPTSTSTSSNASISMQAAASSENESGTFAKRGQEPVLDAGDSAIRSPSVGIFYRGPNPESPPFVEPGSKVAAGDPLCIIEVMKLFTTIDSPVSGTVKSILSNNSDGVEFDQLLFVIAVD